MTATSRSERPTLHLAFSGSVTEAARARIDYVFRVYCALYGYSIVEDADAAGVTLLYGTGPGRTADVVLEALYEARDPDVPAKSAPPEADPLGDAFEWISSAQELAAAAADDIGRVPPSATLHGRFGLDPAKPYAAMAFRRLDARVREAGGGRWPAGPTPPAGLGVFCVANIHDVDFFPLGPLSVGRRLAKNVAIAVIKRRDLRSALDILRRAGGDLLRGRLPLSALRRTVDRERREGLGATYTFIARQGHRRDANYTLADSPVREALGWLRAQGVEVGVHGSYNSLQSDPTLAAEYDTLAGEVGVRPVGGRQHWLRYRGAELPRALRDAGAAYDSSVGYSHTPGFRTGACFPYPPYDFEAERPFPLLQLPLALMDVSVYGAHPSPAAAETAARSLMRVGREFGWGGFSVLWHDTVLSGCELREAHSELFWKLRAPQDRWLSAREIVEKVWPRYVGAGLLPPRTFATP